MNTNYRLMILFFLFIGLFDLNNSNAQNDFWEQTNGQFTGEIRDIITNDLGYLFIGTIGGGIYRSTDDAETWVQMKNGFTGNNCYAMAISNKGNIYVANEDGVFLSTNNGDKWIRAYTGKNGINAMVINSLGVIFCQCWTSSMGRSSDDGMTWNDISYGLTQKGLRPLAITPQDNIYVGSIYLGAGVFQYDYKNNYWNKMSDPGDGYANVIETNSLGHVFVANYSVVYRTNDKGYHWVQIFNQVLNDHSVWSMITTKNNHIFIGTNNNGVYHSKDDGNNWVEENSGLTDTTITHFAVNKDGRIFAVTKNKGIFRSVHSVTSVNEFSNRSVNSYSLFQNSPNPFSSSTSIQFQLQKPTHVTLKIFNALGVEIKTLIDNHQYEAGTHLIDFNLRSSLIELRTGIYFYQLITPEFTQTKKMVVLR